MNTYRAYTAIISLAVGMFLLLEGSRLMHPIEWWIDLVFIVVGAVLVLAYLPLMGNYLELKFKAPPTISFMPILLVLGAVMIYQGVTRPIGIFDKSLFVILGAVLVAVPAFVLYRAAKGKIIF